MMPMVYLEFREIYGRSATLSELIQTISRYPLKEWLAVLSRIEFYFERDGFDFYSPLMQRGLAQAFFPAPLIEKLKVFEARPRSPQVPYSLFFTYSQILNLRRLAILHAPETATESLVTPPLPEPAAAAFLQMNELSDSIDLTGQRPDQSSISSDEIIELCIRQFYLNHVPIKKNLFGRLETLLFELPKALSRDPDFIDLESACEQVVGIGLRDYFSGLWAFSAQWAGRSSSSSKPWSVSINVTEYLSTTKLNPRTIDVLKPLVTATPDTMRDAIRRQMERFQNHWPYSTLPMRQHPFLEISPNVLTLLGLGFAFDKMASGIYYLLEERLSDADRARFRPFFGRLCQRYVEDLCLHFLGPRFQKERKYHGQGGSVHGPDGLIEAGTTLYVLEVKSSPLRLITKTTGALGEFRRDGERRHGFLKAARQLDGLITDFIDGRFKAFEKGPLKYHAIVPVMVSYEPLPEDERVSEWMQEQIHDQGFLRQHNVGKLQILSMQELELLLPVARDHGWGEVMSHKMGTPSLNKEGFHEFLRLRHPDASNELVNAASERFMDDASSRIIGPDGESGSGPEHLASPPP